MENLSYHKEELGNLNYHKGGWMLMMRYSPYSYQKQAEQWILDHERCCLFLDMGLGKTVITLTAISKLMYDCEILKVLVVAPKKVAEATWHTEASKWNHLRCITISRVIGSEAKRIKALEEDADVYVIGRDSVTWLLEYYLKQKYGDKIKGKKISKAIFPFQCLILDELTSFKNYRAKRFKSIRVISAAMDRVIGLTGTPAPNGLLDLWAEMYCVDLGEHLGRSFTAFRESHFKLVIHNNITIKAILKPEHDRIIREKVEPICLSMNSEGRIELPELIVNTELVELPDSIFSQYKDFERSNLLELMEQCAGSEDKVLVANNAAALMNKLSQFSNGAVYDEEHEVHEVHDEKLTRLTEIIEAAQSPVLVFYQYKHDVPRIKKALKGYQVCVYKDETDLENWNLGKIDVLLAHPASTAYGLNMQQGGHYIVWFGLTWNLELYQQANARLYRQGQKQTVFVYRLLCAETVDELVSQALDGKKSTQQALLDGLEAMLRTYGVYDEDNEKGGDVRPWRTKDV